MALDNQNQEYKSLKIEFSNITYKHNVVVKELNEKNKYTESILQTNSELREDLSNKDTISKDLIRLTAVHDKCKRRFGDLEANIRDLTDARNNCAKERNRMVSSIRSLVYNNSGLGMTSFESSENENQDKSSQTAKKKGCQTPDCNGSGHKNGRTKSHRM